MWIRNVDTQTEAPITKVELDAESRIYKFHKGGTQGISSQGTSTTPSPPAARLPLRVKGSNNRVCHPLLSHA